MFYSNLSLLLSPISGHNELEEQEEMRELKKRLSRKVREGRVREGRKRLREGNWVSISIT